VLRHHDSIPEQLERQFSQSKPAAVGQWVGSRSAINFFFFPFARSNRRCVLSVTNHRNEQLSTKPFQCALERIHVFGSSSAKESSQCSWKGGLGRSQESLPLGWDSTAHSSTSPAALPHSPGRCRSGILFSTVHVEERKIRSWMFARDCRCNCLNRQTPQASPSSGPNPRTTRFHACCDQTYDC